MENTDMYIGQMLDGRYEILEKIGTGGMAVVYKARCHRLNRLVAVKILKADLAQDEDFRRRFHAESQAVAMLSHPNIVSVYDVSSSGNIDYIVMELIEGITLKQYINRKGQLNWKEVLHFSTQIVKAVSHAHSRGIIHRDIKPHNIMVLKDGSVKVADFGIARLLTTQQNTLTQEALGSVHYISPEQAKGSHVDFRTDIYSIGVVMYEMLTSRLPFEGDSAVSIALQHINSVPLMPREINPNVPLGLEQITMHAMAANLEERYNTAEEMLADLEEFRKNPDMTFDYVMPVATPDSQQAPMQSSAVKPAPAMVPSSSPRRRTNTKTQKKEDYRKNKKKAGTTSVLIGIVCILLFLICIFIFMYKVFLKDMLNPSDEKIIVANFVGSMYEDVINDEDYKNYYNFTYTYETSYEYKEGQIISQDPKANRQMTLPEGGIDVKLVVSSGEETQIMPDILNIDYRKAKIDLENLGLDLDIQVEEEYDDNVTEGYVISQVPEKGETLKKGSTVYITRSLGPEKVSVPSVVGLTVSQAKAKLDSSGLTYEIEYVDDDAPEDEVIFQSINAGDMVPPKELVRLQVSNGPQEPEPEPVTPSQPSDPGTSDSDTGGGSTDEEGAN